MGIKKNNKAATAMSEPIEPLRESRNGFSQKEKQYNRSMKRIQESYPMVGAIGNSEDKNWRSLTSGSSNRDLNSVTQERMREIAFWLWDSNPMAHRIVEITSDFVVGNGFSVVAEDDAVQEVIDKFWNDPENKIEEAQNIDVRELSLFGELCFPVWVNPIDGQVKLGYLDPSLIKKVLKNPKNPRLLGKVKYVKRGKNSDVQTLNIVATDKRVTSKTYGYRTGDCLFYTINNMWSTTRGRSDILPLADWIDGHDQFLFARLERAFLLNTFIWDVECEGMNEADLKEFVKTIGVPKAGSIRAHNEKIKWSTVEPKLESDDASQEARLFKNQILGGAGYPEHWFAEGGGTTRATALEMSLPTLKRLRTRQKFVKFMYANMIEFQIDQSIIHGTLSKNVNRNFVVNADPIISRDNKGMAVAVKNFTEGLAQAQEKEWITENEASHAFRLLLTQCGAEFSPEMNKAKQKGIIKSKKGGDE